MTHPRSDRQDGRQWLILAAIGSFAVALLHVAIIFVGASAYRYFGAGDLVPLAEQGSAVPALITSVLVVLFAVWGAYALSGAGVIRPLPLLRVALVLIAAIYTLRGLLLVPELIQLARGGLAEPRMAVFSAVSLAIGVLYLAGVVSSRRRKAALAG